MRLLAYKLLTAQIIALSRLRFRIIRPEDWEMRKDRDAQNKMRRVWFSKGRGILVECCDCGLTHRFFESEQGSHAIPERPKGYDYHWRLGR